MIEAPPLSVAGLSVRFRRRGGGEVVAVRDVSFTVGPGEALGLVGESGSGKTTAARAALRLGAGTVSGRVRLFGLDPYALSARSLRALRRRAQPVFQNPYASLNPALSVGEAVGEPLRIHGLCRGGEVRARARDLLVRVGIDATLEERRPAEFSGGQRQRIAIARALALSPDLLLLDEPVSALDVSEQARILSLLAELRRERGLSFLFVSHDLRVVRHVCDRVAVLYRGVLLEEGPSEAVLARPAHPYTRALVAAAPRGEQGGVASVIRPASATGAGAEGPGCPFVPRCPHAEPACRAAEAVARRQDVDPGHWSQCRMGSAGGPSV